MKSSSSVPATPASEAALAAARMGLRTALLTIKLRLRSASELQPAIGGVAKGQSSARSMPSAARWGDHRRDGAPVPPAQPRQGAGDAQPRAQCDKKRTSPRQADRRRQEGLTLRQEMVESLLVGAIA